MLYTHKIIICYIGIIFITAIVFLYYKNKKDFPVREGLKLPDFKKLISNALTKPFKPVLDFIAKVNDVFTQFPKRFKMLKAGFEKIGKGIEKLFLGIPAAATLGANDIGGFSTSVGDYIQKLFIQYIGPGIECGFQKIGDFNNCFKYYGFNLFMETMYSIVIGLPIFIVKTGSGGLIDLEPTINTIWEGIVCIDEFIYGAVGYHFIQWSDDIMEKCFLCSKLKPAPSTGPILNSISKIKHDFNYTIPKKLWNGPTNDWKSSASNFKQFAS